MALSFSIGPDTLSPTIQALAKEYPKAAQRLLGQSGLKLWQHIIHENPKPHIDTGYARNSISVHVGGKSIHSAPGAPASAGGPLEAVVAMNAPYAAKLHELPPDSMGPKSRADGAVGPKFVEAKLLRHKDDYIKHVADNLLNEIKKDVMEPRA